jgi:hypothetical protein
LRRFAFPLSLGIVNTLSSDGKYKVRDRKKYIFLPVLSKRMITTIYQEGYFSDLFFSSSSSSFAAYYMLFVINKDDQKKKEMDKKKPHKNYLLM